MGKSLILKRRSKRSDRELKILLGLVELHLKTGKPVGSNTLKEEGFGDLSSATIRNYFAHLEEEGFLDQQHASGGRIPTSKAFRFYADHFFHEAAVDPKDIESLTKGLPLDTKEPTAFLARAAERLSSYAGFAVCLSAPRFDHDFILDIKLVAIDPNRCACILVTDFGLVKTEVLQIEARLSSFALKRMEGYFLWRLRGRDKPVGITPEEEKLAQRFYEEIMIRYIVGYGNFSHPDIFRTGFSRLFNYPEFKDPVALANGLALFENIPAMQRLLAECQKKGELLIWIGEELQHYSPASEHCALIAIPYRINQITVGAICLLGPARAPYRKLFGMLRFFSDTLSDALTRSLYKFKLQFRQPDSKQTFLETDEGLSLGKSSQKLLENKPNFRSPS